MVEVHSPGRPNSQKIWYPGPGHVYAGQGEGRSQAVGGGWKEAGGNISLAGKTKLTDIL